MQWLQHIYNYILLLEKYLWGIVRKTNNYKRKLSHSFIYLGLWILIVWVKLNKKKNTTRLSEVSVYLHASRSDLHGWASCVGQCKGPVDFSGVDCGYHGQGVNYHLPFTKE